MKFINKFLFTLLLFISALYKTQVRPPAPPGGGGGGVGPGAPASPIDAYIYLLVIIGAILIVIYSRRKTKKIII